MAKHACGDQMDPNLPKYMSFRWPPHQGLKNCGPFKSLFFLKLRPLLFIDFGYFFAVYASLAIRRAFSQIRDSGIRLFASVTSDHELKVSRVPVFLELAPQTVLHYGTKTGRLVVRDFRVVCGQGHFATGRFVAGNILRTLGLRIRCAEALCMSDRDCRS